MPKPTQIAAAVALVAAVVVLAHGAALAVWWAWCAVAVMAGWLEAGAMPWPSWVYWCACGLGLLCGFGLRAASVISYYGLLKCPIREWGSSR